MIDRLSAVLLPMAVALVLAYILDPVVEFLSRKGVPRLRAIVIVFFGCTVLVAGLLASVVPGFVSEARELIEDMPENTEKFRTKLETVRDAGARFGISSPALNYFTSNRVATAEKRTAERRAATARPRSATNQPPEPAQTNVEFNLSVKVKDNSAEGETNTTPESVSIKTDTQRLKRALDAPVATTVTPGLAKVLIFIAQWITTQFGQVGTWIEFIIGFVLVPVYLFYFLLEKNSITGHWTDYLPLQESRAKDEMVFIVATINQYLIAFFRGQVLVALCVGVLLAIGYLAMGLNYAVLLAVVAAVLGIVPYLGTVINIVLALTVAMIQFGDWEHPLLVLGIAAVVKLLEDFLISPKIMGHRAGMHPLAIIIAVLTGTILLGGILGALIAIPMTAVLKTLMFRYVWKKREAVVVIEAK